jgi:hypothetical protein
MSAAPQSSPWADLAVMATLLVLWGIAAAEASRERRRRIKAEAEMEGLRQAAGVVATELCQSNTRLAQGWAHDSIEAAVHRGAIAQEQEPCPRCGSARVEIRPRTDATWQARCLDCNLSSEPDPTPAQARMAWSIAQPKPKGGS